MSGGSRRLQISGPTIALNSPDRGSTMHRAGLRLLLSIASILLGLAVAEIGLRVAGIAPPEVRSYDPVRGWQLRPGVIGLQRSEGHSRVTINDGGFRGPEVSTTK